MTTSPFSLEGKTAIITGGGTGIGKSMAIEFARAGADVAIASRKLEHLEPVAKEIEKLGKRTFALAVDVRQEDQVQGLVERTVKEFGRLDIMVNNAGIETRTSVLDTTEEEYHKVLDINLKSAFFGTQLAAKQMIAQGDGGRIVNLSSVHEDWPMTGNAAYAVSKGGMRMLTRQAGVFLAPHGITVVGVGPGAVATPINQSTLDDPQKLKTINAAIPLGRMAKPEEIGSVVAFVAGDGASYVTATTIIADGGLIQSSPGL
jgi:glucose 1-dehydrogenase